MTRLPVANGVVDGHKHSFKSGIYATVVEHWRSNPTPVGDPFAPFDELVDEFIDKLFGDPVSDPVTQNSKTTSEAQMNAQRSKSFKPY